LKYNRHASRSFVLIESQRTTISKTKIKMKKQFGIFAFLWHPDHHTHPLIISRQPNETSHHHEVPFHPLRPFSLPHCRRPWIRRITSQPQLGCTAGWSGLGDQDWSTSSRILSALLESKRWRLRHVSFLRLRRMARLVWQSHAVDVARNLWTRRDYSCKYDNHGTPLWPHGAQGVS
jgi:hypothetical protein